jgi:hypothetical protein
MAGTLSVQKIQGLASSATPTTVEIASGHKISGNVTHGADSVFPAGHTLQTLHLANTTTTATSSTSFGLMAGSNLAITPSSTSSKILVNFTYHMLMQNGSNSTWRGGLVRLMNVTADTVLQTDTDYGTVIGYSSGDDRIMIYQGRTFLHSPSTASAITYGLECRSSLSGYSVSFNNAGLSSGGSITLQEIAG